MMISTVLKLLTWRLPALLTQRPDLLVDHVLAYADLAKTEIDALKQRLLRQIIAGAIALAMSLAFVVVSGVALMLHAVGSANSDSSWVLLAVPGFMLALAMLAALLALSKGGARTTSSLSAQLKQDARAFRTVLETQP